MGDYMYYLNELVQSQIEIDKSIFISFIEPIHSLSDMDVILKRVKKEYPKATHYCSAYVFENSQGSNDDGEPSKTAGVPILEILNHHQLTNCFAVVVRYFGGIKLGAGGLIRAYAKATKEALNDAKLSKKVTKTIYEVVFTYEKISKIDLLFESLITDKVYLEDCIYELSFEDDFSLLETHEYLFKKIQKKGTKEVLVPWK